jgi:hypothetical protein
LTAVGTQRSDAGAVGKSSTSLGVFRMALLVMGASALACHPASEDFAQRRLQLDEEFAAMSSALDQLDARLQRGERRQLEWGGHPDATLRRLHAKGTVVPAVQHTAPRLTLTREDGPEVEVTALSHQP